LSAIDLNDLYATRPDLYDLMHADQVDDMRFMQEFVEVLGENPRVLELGCGTGRLLIPMLDAGATVVGLDREPAMIEVARRHMQAFGRRASIVEGDMRDFTLDGYFDLALIGLNTFMHLLTIKAQLECLTCIHRHLRPAGLLLLDLANPYAVTRDTPLGVVQHRLTRRTDTGVTTLLSATTMAPAEQLAHTVLFFDETDRLSGQLRRSVSEVMLRLIYRFELELLLARAGFSIRHLYGDYESSPFDDESERLICVAAALS